MQSVLFSLLPSVLVLLFSNVVLLPGKNEVLALPIAIPRPPPGSKVVIVVGNGGGKDGAASVPGPPTMVTGESQVNERKTMLLGPSLYEEIKRQGHLAKQMSPRSPSELIKTEKSRLGNLIPSSARHISGGAHDIFHQRKNFPGGNAKLMSNDKQTGPRPRLIDFRPHQPDITSDMQHNNGKLSLPVMGFTGDNNGLGAGLGTPRPTPMANKLNPFTNGVANSFPPGIDPYEGFIRYAAENLDTPMGNVVDYHSLEHYYGPQHPLSPYHSNKDKGNVQSNPYADSFGYNNGAETENSPPPPPPPPHSGPHDFGESSGGRPGPGPSGGYGDTGGGFRSHNNPLGSRPGGPRGSNHNPITPHRGHGIDHFNAPSPGLGAAPPRPGPPTSDPALYEEEHGYRSPPFEPPHPDSQPYNQNQHGPPFNNSPSPSGGDINSLQYDGDGDGPDPPNYGHSPDPPDLDVFDEGPPPSESHPPLPSPMPPHQGQNNPEQPQSIPEQQNNDGGDDSIWGILDLAEMIEKGEIPGMGNASATPANGKPQAVPQRGASERVVIPIFTRPPPPRNYASSSSNPDEDGPPSEGARGASDGGGFDYDYHPAGQNNKTPSYGGPLDSQETNDYGDDSYSK